MWNRKVFVRIIELLLCIGCVIALRVTDDESRRVFHFLRNRSREWRLLNNVTWGAIGAALATVTCGGYIIITAGLLLAAATGELRGRKTEVLLLGVGVILFGIVGALSMASIDSVPEDLVDNAAVLGALCLITALVFIADMLMSPRFGKKKQEATQTISSKEQAAKQYVTTTTMTINNEKEAPPRNVATWRSPTPEMTEKRSSMNDSPAEEDDREHRLERAERQMREYAQNIENGRGARNKQLQRGQRDRDDVPRKSNGYYRSGADDVYQRPVDEVDEAPPFPTSDEGPVFAKVSNPGVKIMRVERDDEPPRGYDNYRYSDSSQYDNVPTRMRGSTSSPGILKRQRDVSFADPRRSRDYRLSGRDEIEILEECFDVLRTSTTTTSTQGTQTTGANGSLARATSTPTPQPVQAHQSAGVPATPNDPGFVRHMSSNWPQMLKNKGQAAETQR